jgi:hypothetical protein
VPTAYLHYRNGGRRVKGLLLTVEVSSLVGLYSGLYSAQAAPPSPHLYLLFPGSSYFLERSKKRKGAAVGWHKGSMRKEVACEGP